MARMVTELAKLVARLLCIERFGCLGGGDPPVGVVLSDDKPESSPSFAIDIEFSLDRVRTDDVGVLFLAPRPLSADDAIVNDYRYHTRIMTMKKSV